MKIQRVPSKWAKTQALLTNAYLASFVPDTRKYEFSVLQEMLELYKIVYIKPNRGTFGIGVMRAEMQMNPAPGSEQQQRDSAGGQAEATPLFLLRYGTTTEIHSTLQELYAAIQTRIQGRLYLIQQGISLLHSRGRPFDLRILAQKSPNGLWETTGMLGRVAAPMKIVTNYHNGGRIRPLRPLLEEQMSGREANLLSHRLIQLGVDVGRQLELTFPRIKEIGLDVAVDEHYDLWVLEVNTKPSLVIFKTFRDKSIYRRIRRYAAAYGRPGFSRRSSR